MANMRVRVRETVHVGRLTFFPAWLFRMWKYGYLLHERWLWDYYDIYHLMMPQLQKFASIIFSLSLNREEKVIEMIILKTEHELLLSFWPFAFFVKFLFEFQEQKNYIEIWCACISISLCDSLWFQGIIAVNLQTAFRDDGQQWIWWGLDRSSSVFKPLHVLFQPDNVFQRHFRYLIRCVSDHFLSCRPWQPTRSAQTCRCFTQICQVRSQQ